MRGRYALAAAVGLSVARSGAAQTDDAAQLPVQTWTADHVLNHTQHGYSRRTAVVAWDSGTATETGGTYGGPGPDAVGVTRMIGDDIIWATPPGPDGGFVVDGVRFGAWVAGNNTVDIADHRITLYPVFNEAGNPVYSGTPVEQIVVRLQGHLGANGQGFLFASYIDVSGGQTIPPGAGVFAYMDVVDDATLPSPSVVPGINHITRRNGVMPVGGGNLKRYVNPFNAASGSPSTPSYPTNWMAAFLSLRTTPSLNCDFADSNCDGALNGFDVQAVEEAVNGDQSNLCLPTADLNGDGAVNGFDVEYAETLTLHC